VGRGRRENGIEEERNREDRVGGPDAVWIGSEGEREGGKEAYGGFTKNKL